MHTPRSSADQAGEATSEGWRTTRRVVGLGLTVAAVGSTVGLWAAPASAAEPKARLKAGVVTVTGDDIEDTITLSSGLTSGGLPELLVDIDSSGSVDFAFRTDTFTDIVVNARGGNDVVRVLGNLAGEDMTLNGQAGNDQLLGGLGVQTLVGGAGDDTVVGGDGDDVADLGAGDDTFTWNPGDDNDVVDGRRGFDTLDFNGSNAAEKVALVANGSRLRFTRDVAAITMDVGTTEAVDFAALGSADEVTVGDLSATPVVQVDVDLNVVGGVVDGAVDTVIVQDTPRPDSFAVVGSPGSYRVTGAPALVSATGVEPTDILTIAAGDEDQVDATALAPDTVTLVVS